jgi:hypothetical protein
MKVHRILKVWSPLSTKILISSKLVELKMCTAQIPVAPFVYANYPLNCFQIESFMKFWTFLESLHRKLTEKYYMSQQITWNFGAIQKKSIFTLPIFSKFQLWSQIWQ